MPPTTTAIFGAGYLGSAVAQTLRVPTVVTTRTGSWRATDPPRADICVRALDVTYETLDRRALEPGPRGPIRKAVICYAPSAGSSRRALYVEGTERLLAALRDLELERLVYIGSTSALADVDGWVDETADEWPTDERGTVARQAERKVIEFAETTGVSTFILRLAGLYGPGRELERIYRRRQPDPLPGSGNAPTNLIHRDDAVAAIVAALDAPALPCGAAGLVHVCDDDHISRRCMYDRIAAQSGCAPIRWEQPANGAASGKRVCNWRLKLVLGVRLLHPTHGPTHGPTRSSDAGSSA